MSRRTQAAQRQIPFAAAATAVLACAAISWADAIVLSPTADAEIRETQPERTRGFGAPAASGQQAELQISSGVTAVGNRNLALVRFQLPNTINTQADLLGFADLQFFYRAGFNSAATSFRVYGLNPANTLNTAWNEQEVMYRDTGSYLTPNPLIGTGQSEPAPTAYSQTNPGNVTLADPVAPFATSAGYGADPSHPRRAPGIRFENAPFSLQVADENTARFTYNQNGRAECLVDIADGTLPRAYAYLPYINQPGYNVQTTTVLAVGNAISVGDGNPATTGDGFTDIYSDVPESNRPFFSGPTNSWVDDLEDVTYLGFTTLPAGARVAGDSFAFTTNRDGTVEDTSPEQLAINLANLVNFLGAGLANGYRDFTFILGPGIGADGDILNTSNQQIASKDLIATFGGEGAGAPRLLVAPEPGTAAVLAGIGAAAMIRRRRA